MRRVITPRKTPSSPGQPMGNDRVQIAGDKAANRLGQNRRRLRIELEGLEVGALGDVEGRRRQRPRPIDDVAVGVVNRNVAEIGQDAGFGSEDFVGFRTRHQLPERLRRSDAGNAQPGDHVGGDGVGVLELLVEVTGEQQDGVFQFALAVGQRALAEFADHHDGAGENRRNQQRAANGQPQHRTTDRRAKAPAGRRGSRHDILQVVKQNAHSPFSPGILHTMRTCHKPLGNPVT